MNENLGYQIIIKGLNFNTSVNDIFEIFSKFGIIISCRLINNDHNESKGFCFLTYKIKENAEIAIKEMNEKRFEGKLIKVNWSIEKN